MAGLSGRLGEVLDNVNREYGKLFVHDSNAWLKHNEAILLVLDRAT